MIPVPRVFNGQAFGVTMSKFLMLIAFVAATLVGTAALAYPVGTGHRVVPQVEVIHVAASKKKAVKITKTKKRIGSSYTNRQCWSDSDHSVCKFCRPTYDGYCRCEQHFPCE
jgi:hypothetical protein